MTPASPTRSAGTCLDESRGADGHHDPFVGRSFPAAGHALPPQSGKQRRGMEAAQPEDLVLAVDEEATVGQHLRVRARAGGGGGGEATGT